MREYRANSEGGMSVPGAPAGSRSQHGFRSASAKARSNFFFPWSPTPVAGADAARRLRIGEAQKT